MRRTRPRHRRAGPLPNRTPCPRASRAGWLPGGVPMRVRPAGRVVATSVGGPIRRRGDRLGRRRRPRHRGLSSKQPFAQLPEPVCVVGVEHRGVRVRWDVVEGDGSGGVVEHGDVAVLEIDPPRPSSQGLAAPRTRVAAPRCTVFLPAWGSMMGAPSSSSSPCAWYRASVSGGKGPGPTMTPGWAARARTPWSAYRRSSSTVNRTLARLDWL